MNNQQADILIVDDTRANLRLLTKVLMEQGYLVRPFPEGPLALAAAQADPPDLILLDIKMPNMDGYEICHHLKTDERTQDIPVIFISALDETMDKITAFSMGAVDYITKPFQREEVLARIKTHLMLRNLQKHLEEKNQRLQQEILDRKRVEADLKRLNEELEKRVQERTQALQASEERLAQAYEETLEGWAKALELRDNTTKGHSQRVTELTVCLARAMDIPEEQIEHVRRGALLHDIGKMGVPDNILLKNGPLSEEERRIIQNHPAYAYEMLSPIAYLRPALAIPYCHHEKWDGSGYPRQLKGEQIPLAARIFAVVDVWDALRSDRPYHQAWSKAEVQAYLQEQAGKHFDSQVVEVFLKLIAHQEIET